MSEKKEIIRTENLGFTYDDYDGDLSSLDKSKLIPALSDVTLSMLVCARWSMLKRSRARKEKYCM